MEISVGRAPSRSASEASIAALAISALRSILFVPASGNWVDEGDEARMHVCRRMGQREFLIALTVGEVPVRAAR